MSDIKLEAAEPQVAAPAPTNDEVKPPIADQDIKTEPATADEQIKSEAKAKEEEDTAKANSTEKSGKGSANGPRFYENGVLKTTAQQIEGASNSRYDPSILETTDDAAKIRGQVEFYFSDSNLPQDKHMMKLTEGSTNKPVPLKEIHAFGRMRRFQPYSAIVSALRESKFLNVTGEEGAEMISRKIAYDPTTPRSKTEARSVYVKGFGDEEPSSQFDIEAFFSQFGSTNAVRLRRTDQKLFKGSVFVEFSDEETAQKFLALDPKPLWKGKHILQIMSKKAYQDLKDQEIREGKVQPSESWGPRGRGKGRGGGRGGRGPRNDRGDRDKGDRDPNDWKKRREDDRANGFKDNRGGKNNRGQRGGRRGRRDDRGPRNNDRNEERAEKNGDEPKAKEEAPERVENEKKRAREDDGAEEKPAKKVDNKSEVPAETS